MLKMTFARGVLVDDISFGRTWNTGRQPEILGMHFDVRESGCKGGGWQTELGTENKRIHVFLYETTQQKQK